MAFTEFTIGEVQYRSASLHPRVALKIAKRILESMEIATTEACDGQQALSACAFQMPDAVFVDASMPVLDGVEFIKELRRMPEGARPRVVYCTSENDPSLIARALRAGANDFLMKPFDSEDLRSKFLKLAAA